MMITAIASTLMASVSLFLIEYFDETGQVGIYGVAFRISQLIAIVLIVVNTIAAPKFSELFWADKKDELQRVILQSTKLMFWTAFGLSIVVILGAGWILALFGNDFIDGRWTLIALAIGQLINAATGSVGVTLEYEWPPKGFAQHGAYLSRSPSRDYTTAYSTHRDPWCSHRSSIFWSILEHIVHLLRK